MSVFVLQKDTLKSARMRIFDDMKFDRLRFRDCREACGSRDKVSVLSKVSMSAIRDWELGADPNPSMNELCAVLTAINASIAYVFGETDQRQPPTGNKMSTGGKPERFYASVDYEKAEELGLTEEDIKRRIKMTHLRLERIKAEQELADLEELRAKMEAKKNG